MKKLFYTITFIVVTAFTISSCTEQNIKPRDGGSDDKCQFTANCAPKQ